MKSMRTFSRVALLVGLGLAELVACSSDSRHNVADTAATGTLQLPLQATAPSGNVYRLRNAFFQITNIASGESFFLFSEDNASQFLLTTVLNTGDYTITLQPGWFMERVSGGGGSGGSGGAGGFTPGGKPGGGFAGAVPVGGFSAGGMNPAGGAVGVAGKPGRPLPPPDIGSAGEPPEAGAGGVIEEGGAASFGGFPVSGGAPSFGGTPGDVGVFVDAQLVSSATQFFSVFSRSDSFVNYRFQIGGEVLDFRQGRLNVSIDVFEAEPQCDSPPDVTRVERVLMENETAALGGIGLRDVFNALATNGGHNGDGLRLYQQIFDSYASAEQASLPDAVHCGDEVTDGIPTLNGYRIDCDRAEARHVNDIDNFFLTAIVNRIDFTPANGANCGQQRMVFANPSQGRAFMIVEAVVPNPNPELGVKGCLPLAQFWLDQNSIEDPVARGQRLIGAFLKGDPGLMKEGFGPFYTAENLTVGSGQIRTNQFDSAPWTLREFKLSLDGDQLKAIPFPTAEAPNGALWNENSGLPQGEECRENFLSAMEGLLTDDMNQMSFVVDQKCRDAESRNDFSQAYPFQLSDGFRKTLDEKLVGTGLTGQDIAARAQFAGSCIGCHSEASGSNLGRGVVAPFSFDFPHIQEFTTSDCGSSRATACFQTSDAIKQVFLPSRLNTMASLLGITVIPDPCSGGGVGGGGGFSGFPGVGGGSSGGGAFTGSGGRDGMAPGKPLAGLTVESGPAPQVEISLPSANLPISELVRLDSEIRAQSGKLTIAGRSAQSTH